MTGTAAGIAIGGAIIHAIGSDSALLWAILPRMLVRVCAASDLVPGRAGRLHDRRVLIRLEDILHRVRDQPRLLDTLRAVQPRLTEAAAGLVVADRM